MARQTKTVTAGRLDELAVGKFKVMELEGREVGVARLKDGRVVAVRNVCPHKGAPVCRGPVSGTFLESQPGELVFGRDGELLVCPWHGFEFDLATGKALSDDCKLLMFPTRVQDGEVLVEM